MTGFYAYCEKHGQVSEFFSDPNDPDKAANAASNAAYYHEQNTSDSHGRVYVVEGYTKEKYGNEEIRYRQYRKK